MRDAFGFVWKDRQADRQNGRKEGGREGGKVGWKLQCVASRTDELDFIVDAMKELL